MWVVAPYPNKCRVRSTRVLHPSIQAFGAITISPYPVRFAPSVYGLLPICKQIVLLTNQVRLLPYIRLLFGILCCIPSHNEYPLTRS